MDHRAAAPHPVGTKGTLAWLNRPASEVYIIDTGGDCRADASGVMCPGSKHPGSSQRRAMLRQQQGESDMAGKRDSKPEERKSRESTSVSRRDFIKQGMAVGVGAAALGGCAATPSAQGTSADGIKWDYEADVVVTGSGASGLPCAIAGAATALAARPTPPTFKKSRRFMRFPFSFFPLRTAEQRS